MAMSYRIMCRVPSQGIRTACHQSRLSPGRLTPPSTDLSGSTVNITLPGLSETVYSATAFYDWESFSTRINVRYRDRFVSEQVAVETQLAFFDDETVVDYQASYAINDNLSVLFQVNNLTDEPTKTYFNQPAQTGTLQFFGRQYFLGMTYAMQAR